MKPYIITKSSGERFEADSIIYRGFEKWAVVKERGGKYEVKILDDWKVAKRSLYDRKSD